MSSSSNPSPATPPTAPVQPSQITESDIQNAVTDYLREATRLRSNFIRTAVPFQEENLRFNLFGQQPYLLCNRFQLHDLSFSIQRRLAIYLTRQFSVQVEVDSKFYWALTNDALRHSSILNKWYLEKSLKALFSAHFSRAGYAPSHPLVMRYNRALSDLLPTASMDFLSESETVLMYLCYPVLEGILKLILEHYVDENGKVLSSLSDGRNTYAPNTRLDHISNLSVYLHALENNAQQLVSKPVLSQDLRDFRIEIENDFATQISSSSIAGRTNDAWDWIYSLRNVSLHGAIGWQLRSGLLTNLICMLIWHLLEQNERDQACKEIAQRVQTRWMMDFPGQYYPPEL